MEVPLKALNAVGITASHRPEIRPHGTAHGNEARDPPEGQLLRSIQDRDCLQWLGIFTFRKGSWWTGKPRCHQFGLISPLVAAAST